jgi:hypothetical protein
MTFIIPISAFLFAYYFVNVAAFPSAIKKGFGYPPHKRLKPFDCVTCLSVWTSVVLYFLPIEVSEFLFVSFAAGFLGQKIR